MSFQIQTAHCRLDFILSTKYIYIHLQKFTSFPLVYWKQKMTKQYSSELSAEFSPQVLSLTEPFPQDTDCFNTLFTKHVSIQADFTHSLINIWEPEYLFASLTDFIKTVFSSYLTTCLLLCWVQCRSQWKHFYCWLTKWTLIV